jgi:magnesium-transporting ATPase (P-type)
VFVPEGLPIAVTVTLSVIAKELCAKYKVLVRRLGVVDTLGAVTLIASDKTGTITQNKMTLRHCLVGNLSHDVLKQIDDDDINDSPSALQLFRLCALCNSATLEDSDYASSINRAVNELTFRPRLHDMFAAPAAHRDSPDHDLADEKITVASPQHPELIALSLAPPSRAGPAGNAVDTALLQYLSRKVQIMGTRRRYGQLAMLPFNSRNKYMCTVHRTPDQRRLVIVKVRHGCRRRRRDRGLGLTVRLPC